jgi:phosphopantetheinyl transferase
MIALLVIHDTAGRLRDRSARERVTAAQLRKFGQTPQLPIEQVVGGFGRTQYGAPRSANGKSRSRSRGWHAFAASDRPARLGVDIEHSSRAGQARRAAPTFAAGGDERPAAHPASALRTLTRKEAILKARGLGLHGALREQPTLATPRERGWSVTSDDWWLYEQRIGPVLVCLATETPQHVKVIRPSRLAAAPLGLSA